MQVSSLLWLWVFVLWCSGLWVVALCTFGGWHWSVEWSYFLLSSESLRPRRWIPCLRECKTALCRRQPSLTIFHSHATDYTDCVWLCVWFLGDPPVSVCGPGSSVGIATELRAGRSGIESRWGRDFSPVQTGPGAHPASSIMSTGSFLGVKCGRGVLLTTHPLLAPRSWKSRAIPSSTLWATPGL